MIGLARLVTGAGGGHGPSLNFNFVDGSAFSPQITFTRASTATYFDATGTLQSAAIDVPRFDYDPDTLAARGFLIEEQRTNSIRNNTMQGAVIGTPGTNPTNWDVVVSGSGITREVVGTGTEDGITYIDLRFYGTGSGTATPQIRPETTTSIVSAVGQTWTASYYLRIVGGSTTGITSWSQIWQERDAAGVALTTAIVAVSSPTTSALKTQRSVSTRTLTDAAAVRLTNRIQWAFTDGVPVDITLRIGLPQLEQGAFVTSVIPTTTTALTRSADEASVNTLSPWYNATEGTIYAEAVGVNIISGATRRFVEIGDGTSSDRFIVGYSSATNTRFLTLDGGVTQADINVATGVLAGSLVKMAAAYAVNNFQQASNGTLGTADTSATLPTVTSMYLGGDFAFGAASALNGHLRRITYYPRRLSNAELQGITA